jgi:hypothetical protein
VDERGIEPHVKLMDKSERTDGALSRSDFAFDPGGNRYVCPGGKELRNIIACSPSHAVHCLPISRSLRIAGFGESSVSTGGKAAFDHRSLSDGRHPGQGPPRDRVDFRRCNRIVVGRKVFAMLWGVRRQQGGHRVKAAGTGLEIVIDRVSY